jgi:hypothetical protein
VLRLRWVQVVLAAVLAVAGVSASVVKALGWEHWTWLAVTAVGLAAVAAGPGTVLSSRLEEGAKRAQGVREALATGAVGGGRIRIRDVVDPTVLEPVGGW